MAVLALALILTSAAAAAPPANDNRAAAQTVGMLPVSAVGTAEPIPLRVVPECLRACPGDRLPAWSPDGRTIAFVRYVPNPGGGDRRIQALFAMNADGSGVRRLVAGEAPGRFYPPFHTLVWSPDSTRLAVQTEGRVWIVPVTGGGSARLLGPPAPDAPSGFFDYGPSWSPDGRSVAFQRAANGFRGTGIQWCCQVWVARADGSGAASLGGGPAAPNAYLSPLWAPDGRLAYVVGRQVGGAVDGAGEIRISTGDGSDARRVTPVDEARAVRLLAFSRDGAELFFRDSHWFGMLLERVRADGSGRSGVRDFRGLDICCWFSADGVRVAYARFGDYMGPLRGLHAADASTPGEHHVSAGVSEQARRSLTSASWSPDGSRLAYIADGECPALLAVYTARPDGREAKRLTHHCRRTGTARPDRLAGSAGTDALYGRGGDDRLDGDGGADRVDGGPGADVVSGGDGDDRVLGGPGRDRLHGGDGWDALDARDRSPDVVRCGEGRDFVRADRRDAVAVDCELVERM